MNTTSFLTLFLLSLIVLFLNLGLFIVTIGIFTVFPLLIFHGKIGFKIDYISRNRILIPFSAINLLAFALVRLDGIHTMSDSGLSALLELFGIYFSHTYGNAFFITSVILFFTQIVIDIILYKSIDKAVYNKSTQLNP